MITAIHHWWKGNISSIVTVLGDLASGDSHPSYTAVYHRQCAPPIPCCMTESSSIDMCAKQTVAYTNKWYGCARIVFGGCGRRSQCIRCRPLSPCRNIQSTSYRKHTQVPCLNNSSKGTQQIWRDSSLSSLRIANPPVVMSSCASWISGW